jgi:glycosyltransferase involved in cell wall biosynthesis
MVTNVKDVPPLVSIVIPVHRREKLIASTLQSIRDQTVRDWECVVVDDGSADGTASIAEKFAGADGRFRVVKQEKSGSSKARNRGFAQTNPGSKYLTFMDSDDVWLPDALSVLISALEAQPGVIGVHGLADFIDEAGNLWHPGEFADIGRTRYGLGGNGHLRRLTVEEPTSFETVLGTNTVYPPGIMLTRRVYYEKVGPFDSGLARMDDWDMVIRLTRFGDFGFLNKVVLLYRRHTGNISARSALETQQVIRVLQHKSFYSPENSAALRKIVRRVWRAWQLMYIGNKLRASRERFSTGRYVSAARVLPGILVPTYRYLRGYPTLAGI